VDSSVQLQLLPSGLGISSTEFYCRARKLSFLPSVTFSSIVSLFVSPHIIRIPVYSSSDEKWEIKKSFITLVNQFTI
jgi:hypothetical protein